MAKTISQIQATEAALGKLGARDISEEEAEQVLNNAYVIARNLRARGSASAQSATGADRAHRQWPSTDADDRGNLGADELADHHRLELDGPRA